MWPWTERKTNQLKEHPAEAVEVITPDEAAVASPPENEVLAALTELEKHGTTISLTYAQMNGYDEAVTNPLRLDELSELIQAGPNFTQDGIDFALQQRLEALEYYATSSPIPITSFRNGAIHDYIDPALATAHDVMSQVMASGRGNILEGLRMSGVNYRDYLVELAKSKRHEDLAKVVDIVRSKEDVLRPLFLQAYASGKNKYGDIDLAPLIDEIYGALEYFFPRDERAFFVLFPPIDAMMRVAMAWVEEAGNEL